MINAKTPKLNLEEERKESKYFVFMLTGVGNGENRVNFPKEMTSKFCLKGLVREIHR